MSKDIFGIIQIRRRGIENQRVDSSMDNCNLGCPKLRFLQHVSMIWDLEGQFVGLGFFDSATYIRMYVRTYTRTHANTCETMHIRYRPGYGMVRYGTVRYSDIPFTIVRGFTILKE